MASLTLTRMAVRQQWISFRLLLLLALPVSAGFVTVLVSSDPDRTQAVLALGVGVASALAAGIAAFGWADERWRGTSGWLSLRAVPRGSILIAWFLGFVFPISVGIAAASLLAWLATGATPAPPLDVTSYITLIAAGVAAALQAVAIGMLCGSFLHRTPATVLAVLVSAGLLAAGFLLAGEPPLVPTAGLGLIAQANDLVTPLADGLQVAGAGLAMTGVLLGAALLAFDRVDL